MTEGDIPAAEAIPVKKVPSFAADGVPKITKVEIICKKARFDALKSAMSKLGITGMTVSHVLGCGVQGGRPEYYRGVPVETNLLPKVQVEIVVSKIPVQCVIDTAKKVLYTGHIGDGKIFVYDVENVVTLSRCVPAKKATTPFRTWNSRIETNINNLKAIERGEVAG